MEVLKAQKANLVGKNARIVLPGWKSLVFSKQQNELWTRQM